MPRDSNSGGDAARYLSTHAVSCGRCGYDLSGLKQPECPECGVRLGVGLLEDWAETERAERTGAGPAAEEPEPVRGGALAALLVFAALFFVGVLWVMVRGI